MLGILLEKNIKPLSCLCSLAPRACFWDLDRLGRYYTAKQCDWPTNYQCFKTYIHRYIIIQTTLGCTIKVRIPSADGTSFSTHRSTEGITVHFHCQERVYGKAEALACDTWMHSLDSSLTCNQNTAFGPILYIGSSLKLLNQNFVINSVLNILIL